MLLGQLRDVDQALHARHDLDERSEGNDLGHSALDHVPLLVCRKGGLPRIFLSLLQPERYPLPVAIDVEHLDPDLVADGEDLRRVIDVAP